MLLKIHPDNPQLKKLEKAISILKNGGVIIYPTDTAYGIGCDVFNKKAVERICRIKNIEVKKHNFSFICHDLSHISDFTKQLERRHYRIMKNLLPGPYTFILKANNHIPRLFKNKKRTIGIRVPDHKIPREIVRLLGNPILTTSVKHEDASLGYILDPELIYERMKKQVDLVIAGDIASKEVSTVLDCTVENIVIRREGKGEVNFDL